MKKTVDLSAVRTVEGFDNLKKTSIPSAIENIENDLNKKIALGGLQLEDFKILEIQGKLQSLTHAAASHPKEFSNVEKLMIFAFVTTVGAIMGMVAGIGLDLLYTYGHEGSGTFAGNFEKIVPWMIVIFAVLSGEHYDTSKNYFYDRQVSGPVLKYINHIKEVYLEGKNPSLSDSPSYSSARFLTASPQPNNQSSSETEMVKVVTNPNL